MRRLVLVVCLVLFIFVCSGCANKEVTGMTVVTSESLRRPMVELQKIYEEDNGVKINLIFEDSTEVNKKIQKGKNIDVFVCADTGGFDKLIEDGKIIEDSFGKVASNSIVLIANKNIDINDLSDLQTYYARTIAMPKPGTAIITKYAKQALEHYGIGSKIDSKFIYADSISEVFEWVVNRTADVGFVYKTDLYMNDKVKIVEEIVEEATDPILYFTGISSSSKYIDESRKFVDFINSKRAKTVLKKYNFVLIEEINK